MSQRDTKTKIDDYLQIRLFCMLRFKQVSPYSSQLLLHYRTVSPPSKAPSLWQRLRHSLAGKRMDRDSEKALNTHSLLGQGTILHTPGVSKSPWEFFSFKHFPGNPARCLVEELPLGVLGHFPCLCQHHHFLPSGTQVCAAWYKSPNFSSKLDSKDLGPCLTLPLGPPHPQAECTNSSFPLHPPTCCHIKIKKRGHNTSSLMYYCIQPFYRVQNSGTEHLHKPRVTKWNN